MQLNHDKLFLILAFPRNEDDNGIFVSSQDGQGMSFYVERTYLPFFVKGSAMKESKIKIQDTSDKLTT